MSAAAQEPEGADPFDGIIESLNKHEVDFLMVGGWAVIYHGFNRVTEDMDIFVRGSEEGAPGMPNTRAEGAIPGGLRPTRASLSRIGAACQASPKRDFGIKMEGVGRGSRWSLQGRP
jgi:hypothetical protein